MRRIRACGGRYIRQLFAMACSANPQSADAAVARSSSFNLRSPALAFATHRAGFAVARDAHRHSIAFQPVGREAKLRLQPGFHQIGTNRDPHHWTAAQTRHTDASASGAYSAQQTTANYADACSLESSRSNTLASVQILILPSGRFRQNGGRKLGGHVDETRPGQHSDRPQVGLIPAQPLRPFPTYFDGCALRRRRAVDEEIDRLLTRQPIVECHHRSLTELAHIASRDSQDDDAEAGRTAQSPDCNECLRSGGCRDGSAGSIILKPPYVVCAVGFAVAAAAAWRLAASLSVKPLPAWGSHVQGLSILHHAACPPIRHTLHERCPSSVGAAGLLARANAGEPSRDDDQFFRLWVRLNFGVPSHPLLRIRGSLQFAVSRCVVPVQLAHPAAYRPRVTQIQPVLSQETDTVGILVADVHGGTVGISHGDDGSCRARPTSRSSENRRSPRRAPDPSAPGPSPNARYRCDALPSR